MGEQSKLEREQAWQACPACETISYGEAFKRLPPELREARAVTGDKFAKYLPGFEHMTEHAGLVKCCAEHAEASNG
jgi:hypothetical protein